MTLDEIFANPQAHDLSCLCLGKCSVESPMVGQRFVDDEQKILLPTDAQTIRGMHKNGQEPPALEQAGPRRHLFHDPAWTRAAIVTCGGLAPGLNAVIKGVVQVLHFDYGVKNIFGIPYGYRGLNPAYRLSPVQLTPESVDTLHEEGGTVLGSSRGDQDPVVMVDTLQRLNINILFCVGGDGTLRGAHAIHEEVVRRKLPISIVGIPKTIDNDLNLVDRTFGFETAVYKAAEIIANAHVEARGAYNGLSIVKLMGRDSGFIAAYATLANTVVNICLIPEVQFQLDGNDGLMRALERRFRSGKTHCVVVVAEGAGQDLFKDAKETRDASGNVLKHDIGDFLCERIKQPLFRGRIGCRSQVFRPELLHPFRPRARHRRDLLLPARRERGPRGHGGAHRHRRGSHERHLHARAHPLRNLPAQEDRRQRTAMARGCCRRQGKRTTSTPTTDAARPDDSPLPPRGNGSKDYRASGCHARGSNP